MRALGPGGAGALRALGREGRARWSRRSFAHAAGTCPPCARWGVEARVRWPRVGRVRVADLLLEQLIPQSVQGLIELGTDVELAKRYGSILTERARTGRNGTRWPIDTVTSLALRGSDQASSLAEIT